MQNADRAILARDRDRGAMAPQRRDILRHLEARHARAHLLLVLQGLGGDPRRQLVGEQLEDAHRDPAGRQQELLGPVLATCGGAGERTTGETRSKETPPSQDPTVALCLGTYGAPRGVGVPYERGTHVVRVRGLPPATEDKFVKAKKV